VGFSKERLLTFSKFWCKEFLEALHFSSWPEFTHLLWLGGEERARTFAAFLLQKQLDLDPARHHGITRDGQIV